LKSARTQQDEEEERRQIEAELEAEKAFMALAEDSDEAIDNPFGNNDPTNLGQEEIDLESDKDEVEGSSVASGEQLGGLLATLAKNNTMQGINLDSAAKTEQNLQDFDKELEELGLKNEGETPDKLDAIDYYQ